MEVYSKHTGGYMPKEARAEVARDLRSTHFKLGCFGPEFGSAYKNSFAGSDGSASAMNEEQLSNIRRSHFDLGSDMKSIATDSEYF
jgi:hypothetical protein